MKKIIGICFVICITLCMLSLAGCSNTKKEEQVITKVKDMDFTVCQEENLPKELKKLIEEKKDKVFKLSYSTKEYMYIAKGYGEQDSGGYSITVSDLYLGEKGVYIKTNLLGPKKEEKIENTKSFPYIVVKTEFYDKPVIFE